MSEPITINALLQLGGIIAAFWGGYWVVSAYIVVALTINTPISFRPLYVKS